MLRRGEKKEFGDEDIHNYIGMEDVVVGDGNE